MSKAKTDYAAKDLQNADLRDQDFTQQVLFGADLRGARLDGLKLSFTCATFHGVKLDDGNISLLLLMFSKIDASPGWSEGLEALVRQQMGDRRFANLMALLKLT